MTRQLVKPIDAVRAAARAQGPLAAGRWPMKAIARLAFAAALLLAVVSATATAQDSSSESTLYTPESAHGIEDILDQLAEPDEEDAQVLEDLLHTANTNSPRDTIFSFIRLTQRYYDLLHQDEFTAKDAAERQRIFDEMRGYFDLRNVAPSLRQDVAVASAVYLREIIDRVGLPSLERIPNREQMLAAIQAGHPPTWRIGDIPLEIARIDSGPQQDRYLFSEETLRTVKSIFLQIRSFPYRDSSAEDFYRAYFLTPNPALRAWTDRLPEWMQDDFLEQTVWQWLAMFLVFSLAILLIWFVSFGLKRLTRNATPLTRSSTLLLVPLIAVLTSYTLYDLLNDKIFITGEVFQVAVYVIYGIALAAAVVFIFSLGTVASDLVASSERAQRRPADVHLARLGIRLFSIIVIIVVLLEGMRLIGFSLATILAGAGVTGLAVALAAQNALRNIFGSLMLLLDKSFEVGQRVKIHGHEGFVEQIGMRSTKLRLFSGHLVSIPNESVADMDVENVSLRPSLRRTTNITITYNTPLEKIQRAVAILREILAVPEGAAAPDPGSILPPASLDENEARERHPNEAINHPDRPPRVFFNELNPDSLNIIVMYWYHPPDDFWGYFEHCQQINNEIIRRFREEGIEFAFPTQTIHIGGEPVAPFPAIETADKSDVATSAAATALPGSS